MVGKPDEWWQLYHAVKQDLEKKRKHDDDKDTSGLETKQVSVLEKRIVNGRNILYEPFVSRNDQFVLDLIEHNASYFKEWVMQVLADIQKKRRDDHDYEVISELGYNEMIYLLDEGFGVEVGSGAKAESLGRKKRVDEKTREKLRAKEIRKAEEMKEESDERLDQHQREKKIIEEFAKSKGRFDKVEEELANIRKTLQVVLDRQLERLGKEEQIKAEKRAGKELDEMLKNPDRIVERMDEFEKNQKARMDKEKYGPDFGKEFEEIKKEVKFVRERQEKRVNREDIIKPENLQKEIEKLKMLTMFSIVGVVGFFLFLIFNSIFR